VRQRQKEKKARGSKHEAAQIERQVKQEMEGQDPALVREAERQHVKHSHYLRAVILMAESNRYPPISIFVALS
jgi:hypothetical protein